MLHRFLFVALLLTATAGNCQSPPFSSFNCRPTGKDDKPCERVKWPKQQAYLAFNEVEAAIREAHSGLSVHIPNPWLRLGDLSEQEAPACANINICAVIEKVTNANKEVIRVDVKMREWDLRIFCTAWAEVFEQHYRDRLTEKQLHDALVKAVVNAEYRVSVNALKDEKR